MAVPAERAFWKSLQTKAFSPVYYLYGDDEYLKDQALRALLASAVDPATRDFNLDVRSGADVDAETVGSLVGTPPMMAERRVVVFRDVQAMKKDARTALDRAVGAVINQGGTQPDVVVVLVAQGGQGKPDRGLESKSLAVEFAPLASERVPKWITHHVTTELGTSITPDAVALLHRAVGNDLPALAAELDKLASYAGGGEIDEAAVAAVVGVRRGETLGDFLDRVAARDVGAALALLPHILEQPKTTAVSVVMALTTQTLALSHAIGLRERGVPAGRLEDALFTLLRAAPGSFTGRPWGDAVRAWTAAAGRWDAAAVDAAFEALLCADVALKETRVSSDEQILSTLVLTLTAQISGDRGRGETAPGRRQTQYQDPSTRGSAPAPT